MRKQLKPVVLTQIIQDMPEDIRGAYRNYLEQNKSNILKYINLDDNEPTKNIFKQLDSKKFSLGYPKLKPFIKNEKGKQQFLEINDESVLPKTRTFKFEKKKPHHLIIQKEGKILHDYF